MSEQNPYERLDVTENASFEEIQEAKNRLTQQYRDDTKVVESIEAAYDAIIMERLRMRQEGRIKVPDRIRFPERVAEAPANLPSLPVNNSPAWLKQLFDTPSKGDILWSAIGFLILAGITAFAGGNLSLLPLLLVFGVFANLYFLNRKEKRFGRSLLITLMGLLLGVGLGTGLSYLLTTANLILPLAGEQIACLVTFFLFWLISSFLK